MVRVLTWTVRGEGLSLSWHYILFTVSALGCLGETILIYLMVNDD